MTAQPTLMIPVDLAAEITAMREELAQLREVVAPLLAEAGWMTVDQASKEYSVDVSTINRWVKNGRMRAKGAGASRRVQMA